MTNLNFPSDPTIGDIYTFNGKQWEWNGGGWALVPIVAGVTSLNELTGDIVLQGSAGIGVTVQSGNVIGLENLGITGINSMTGQVQLQAGIGLTITPQSGNVLVFSASFSSVVSSLNTLTGDVTLQAGSNITITPQSGNVLAISSTGGGATVNGLSGDVTLQGGGGTTVAVESGNVIRVSSAGSGGVDSLNSMVGAVTLQAGSGVTLSPQSGNVILISSSGGGDSYGDAVLADTPSVFLRFIDGQWLNAGKEFGSLPGQAGTAANILMNQAQIVANAQKNSRTVRFNATSAYFALNGCGTIMSALNRSFSFDCWVKTGSALTGPWAVISMGTGGWYLRISGSKFDVFNSGVGTVFLTGSTTLSTNTIYHIGFTVGAGTPYTLTMYLNGVSDGSLSSSVSFTGSAQKYIGADHGPTEYGTNLSVAEMAYYASLLSSTRMLAHYNAGI
jgi:hypothetical protein